MNTMMNITAITEDNVLYQRNPHEYNNMSDGVINSYLATLLPTDEDNRKEEKMNDGVR